MKNLYRPLTNSTELRDNPTNCGANLATPDVWRIETADSAGYVGLYTSIALDASGSAHISYYDATNGDLKYATNASGSWVIQTVDSAAITPVGEGEYTSIALDASGRAHISYWDGDYSDLKYATNASGSWVIQTVDSTGYVGLYTSIALDASGSAHISYLDATYYNNNNYLKYATNASGSWVAQTVDSVGYMNSGNSIGLDASGSAHISYYDATNGDLKYATNASGSWVIQTVDSAGDVGLYNSIALDASGRAHISYLDATNNDLKYVTNASSSWVAQTVDSVGYRVFFDTSSIALDASGRAHISYYDAINGDLKYATNASGMWGTQTVDSAGNVGLYNSMALDASGSAHISYLDGTNGDLKYATNASIAGCLEGDIDNSGMVDISDIIKGLRIAIGIDTAPTTETELCRSDLDKDEQVNILDAIKIMRKALALD